MNDHSLEFDDKWKTPVEGCLVTDNPKTQREFFYQNYHEVIKMSLGIHRKDILEIGCGRGTISCYLAQDGYEVTATDILNSAVNLTKHNVQSLGLDIRVKKEDCESLSFNHNRFDGVVSIGVLEHLDDPNYAIREQYRVLKENGILVALIIPQKFSVQTFFQKHKDYHRNSLSREEYIDVLQAKGFRYVVTSWANPYPLIDTKQEKLVTDIYKLIHKIRGKFLKWPIGGSRLLSQGFFIMGIK